MKNKTLIMVFALLLFAIAPAFAGQAYKEIKDEFTGSAAYVAKIRSARNSSSASFGGSSLGLVITKHVNNQAIDASATDKVLAALVFQVWVEIAESGPVRIEDQPLFVKADGQLIKLERVPGMSDKDFMASGDPLFPSFSYLSQTYVASNAQMETMAAANEIEIRVYHDEGEVTKKLKVGDIKQLKAFFAAMKAKGLAESKTEAQIKTEVEAAKEAAKQG